MGGGGPGAAVCVVSSTASQKGVTLQVREVVLKLLGWGFDSSEPLDPLVQQAVERYTVDSSH